MYVTFPAVSVCAFFSIYNLRRVRWCGVVSGQNVFYVNKKNSAYSGYSPNIEYTIKAPIAIIY